MGLPVNMTVLELDLPQTSTRWTASPNLNEGWPQNTTHGVHISLLKPSTKSRDNINIPESHVLPLVVCTYLNNDKQT